MSRRKYRNYWYPAICDAIRNYEEPANSRRELEIKEAIKKTIDEFMKKDEGKDPSERDGALTVQIVTMTMIKHTHTLDGIPANIPWVSYRTAKRLRTSFIYSVGKKLGY